VAVRLRNTANSASCAFFDDATRVDVDVAAADAAAVAPPLGWSLIVLDFFALERVAKKKKKKKKKNYCDGFAHKSFTLHATALIR
jgi:hypothetical protein